MGEPLRLAVIGASGRVGAAVVRLAAEQGMRVVHAERDVASFASGGFDVAIDFSSASLVKEISAIVSRVGAALVTGTTGLGPAEFAALDEASRSVPVLWEPNMSFGVHVLGALLRQAVLALGDGFDIEIVETHHGRKLDAPSGTALRLVEIAAIGRAGAPLQHGRQGRTAVRKRGEIGVHAVRGGDVVGDHSVHLLGFGERLELVHRATHRDLFAHGALRAASWIAGKPAGRYGLDDVLGAG